MKANFDSKTLDSLKIPIGKAKLTLTDARTVGLQYELRPSGGFFTYRFTIDGRQRAIPIGRYGVVTVSDARKRALELARMVALGEDPLEAKDERRQCPTFDEFFQTRYLPFIKIDKRSWDTDVSVFRNHIQPVFGSVKMSQISRGAIQEFLHGKVEAGSAKGSVNRMLVLLRYGYNLAIEWELPGVTENPARKIKPFQENNKIERYVSVEESGALKKTLEASSNPLLKFIVALLLVTGARKQEALRCRWEDINFETKVWRVPLSKSGLARHVTLSDTAIRFLVAVRAHNKIALGVRFLDCPYVFPSPKTLRPFSTIFYRWNTARRKAGLSDLRIHDLRHTFASTLVNSGVSIYEVQKLLGHAHIRTTERYAHLKQDRLQESASIAGRTFAHILDCADPIQVPGEIEALPVPKRISEH